MDIDRPSPDRAKWINRTGITISLLGIGVGFATGALSKPVPGKPPELTGQITATAVVVLLGCALALEGARYMPDPTPPPEPPEEPIVTDMIGL